MRLLGQVGSFSRVSFSQAAGFNPLSLAVPTGHQYPGVDQPVQRTTRFAQGWQSGQTLQQFRQPTRRYGGGQFQLRAMLKKKGQRCRYRGGLRWGHLNRNHLQWGPVSLCNSLRTQAEKVLGLIPALGSSPLGSSRPRASLLHALKVGCYFSLRVLNKNAEDARLFAISQYGRSGRLPLTEKQLH